GGVSILWASIASACHNLHVHPRRCLVDVLDRPLGSDTSIYAGRCTHEKPPGRITGGFRGCGENSGRMLHTQEHAIAGKDSGVRSLVSRPPTDTRKGDYSNMYVR